MFIEVLAVLNCLAFIVLSLKGLQYTKLVEQSWERPWPDHRDGEAFEKELFHRHGIERKRLRYTLAAVLGCYVISVVLSGFLESFWLHGWLRITSLVFIWLGMVAVILRTTIHNSRSFNRTLRGL